MARLLRNLLGGSEPMFSLKLRALESATGNQKTDLKLLSDVVAGSSKTLKALNLDPADTTPVELHALVLNKAKSDDEELGRAFNNDSQKMIDRLASKAPLTQVPVIKDVKIKTILGRNPPRKVMLALGFRSTESMLKRAPLEQLLLGAFLLESINWHRTFAKSLKALTPADITMATPKVTLINPRLIKNGRYTQIVALQCIGLVGVPKFPKVTGSALLTAVLASEGLFHLHARGVLLKLSRFEESCARQIAHFTYTSPEPIGEVGKVNIPWLSCYSFVASNKQLQNSMTEGVVEASDFFWQHPSQVLPMLNQRIEIWDKTTIFGLADETHPISLNISDIAHDLYYRVPLSNSTCTAMRRGLNTELLARYLDKSANKENILKKLGLF